MPQCPRCQTPFEEGQRFCRQCGAPLGGEAPGTPPAAAPSQRRRTGTLLAAAAAVGAVLLVLYFSRPGSPPTPPAPPAPAPQAAVPAPPAPPPQAPAPAAPAVDPEVKRQVQAVLAAMRQGHLNKDLDLYLNAYSPAFPEYDRKRREVMRAWEHFDFVNAYFSIDDLETPNADTVNATVTWNIDVLNRFTEESASSKQTYLVRFAREGEAWRIQTLATIE